MVVTRIVFVFSQVSVVFDTYLSIATMMFLVSPDIRRYMKQSGAKINAKINELRSEDYRCFVT